ncbi:MAG: MFS transporter [Verrucomicrobiae bacterium]|nr:MFS transporter [Verrucomicrobiae bacterium]
MTVARTTTIGKWRWKICALLFFATTINYMDRQVLGLLAPTLQHDLGWSETGYAHIIVAFQAAYAIGLVVFGRGVDLIGTRNGYSLAVLFWSVAAAGHALVRSAFGFGVARFALGLGEAGNFPAAVKAVAEWFPQRERALANGIFNSGCNIGAVLAPLLVPWLAVRWGWQAPFVVLGALGFVWLVFWRTFYESPEKSRRVSSAELADIRGDAPETAAPKISWGKLLTFRQTWAFIVGYAFSAPIWWFYLYWLTKFLNQQYGLDLSNLGPPLVVIYSMTCFGSIGGGWLSSALMRRGWSLNAGRKTAMLVCALCVGPVVFAAHASNLWVATLLIGLAASAHQGWAANLFALASDLFPKNSVASVVGLGGMAGALTAMAFTESTGFILETTGSYWSLFAIASSAYLIALAVIHWLSPRLEPVNPSY